MSNFKAKMHQIQLRSRPRWGVYSAPPELIAGFKRATSKEKEGMGSGEEG